MSNSVTNTKLPNGGGQTQGDNQNARGNLNQTASAKVSAGQGREIFSQVNVNLGANSRNADITRRKDKTESNDDAEAKKTDWKEIKQGTDSSRTSRQQGTDAPRASKNHVGQENRSNNHDNRGHQEQSGHPRAGKSNNNHQTAKENGGGNYGSHKNSNRAGASNNEKNIGSQNLKARGDSSVKSNNKTNRANVDVNYRSGGKQAASNRAHGEANVSTGAPKDAAKNTRLFYNGNQPANGNAPDGNSSNTTAPQTRQLNLTVNVSITNGAGGDPDRHGGGQNGLLGEVINRVFRENDVYLSGRAVNVLVEYRGGNAPHRSGSSPQLIPKEISQLIETIENQILRTADGQSLDKHSNRVTVVIPQELDDQIQAAKNLFAQIFGTSDAKQFSQMSIQERMLAAIEVFLKNLPAEVAGNLQNDSIEKVLAGFLLARGLVDSDSSNRTENLLEMMQSAATGKVSLAAMRDFGKLVKVLISDAAASKSTANLDTAVQKFTRILAAINCLDTVLTAVKLASQSQFAGGSVGRTLAIAQVYELIDRLIQAGQNAMKEAAQEVAQKNTFAGAEVDKNSHNVFPAKTVADLSETEAANQKTGDSKNVLAESVLRKFLEFNPMFVGDKFISAFDNSDDARQAQRDFLDHHQIEIEQWLRSGNHRLVKDIDFEKPIGIVIERNKNDFLSATTARIVLVRDGSAQGWHFLKSFLVA